MPRIAHSGKRQEGMTLVEEVVLVVEVEPDAVVATVVAAVVVVDAVAATESRLPRNPLSTGAQKRPHLVNPKPCLAMTRTFAGAPIVGVGRPRMAPTATAISRH